MNRTGFGIVRFLSRKFYSSWDTCALAVDTSYVDLSNTSFYFTSNLFKILGPILLFFFFLLLIDLMNASGSQSRGADGMTYRSLIKRVDNEEGTEYDDDFEIAEALLDIDYDSTKRRERFELLKSRARIIEACVSDIESALEAVRGGCNSLELCSNRSEGGTTPSHGLVAEVVRRCKLKDICINVLIRPRPGGFNYSYAEFELIIRDILCAYQAGADGIVVGILKQDGSIDVTRMSIISEICARKHLLFTFHRAYDIAKTTPLTSIETIISLGCHRLLTSGRAKTADQGLEIIRSLVGLTEGETELKIIAGSGVNEQNVARLIKAGIQGIHIGSAVCSRQLDMEPLALENSSPLSVSPSLSFTKSSTTTSTSTIDDALSDMNEYSSVDSEKMANIVRKALLGWKSIEIERDELIFNR
jgi:copper homeostasis protein